MSTKSTESLGRGPCASAGRRPRCADEAWSSVGVGAGRTARSHPRGTRAGALAFRLAERGRAHGVAPRVRGFAAAQTHEAIGVRADPTPTSRSVAAHPARDHRRGGCTALRGWRTSCPGRRRWLRRRERGLAPCSSHESCSPDHASALHVLPRAGQVSTVFGGRSPREAPVPRLPGAATGPRVADRGVPMRIRRGGAPARGPAQARGRRPVQPPGSRGEGTPDRSPSPAGGSAKVRGPPRPALHPTTSRRPMRWLLLPSLTLLAFSGPLEGQLAAGLEGPAPGRRSSVALAVEHAPGRFAVQLVEQGLPGRVVCEDAALLPIRSVGYAVKGPPAPRPAASGNVRERAHPRRPGRRWRAVSHGERRRHGHRAAAQGSGSADTGRAPRPGGRAGPRRGGARGAGRALRLRLDQLGGRGGTSSSWISWTTGSRSASRASRVPSRSRRSPCACPRLRSGSSRRASSSAERSPASRR